MKFQKTILFPVLIFFALPIATAFCCCVDFSSKQSRQEMLGHNHQYNDHASYHHESSQEDNTAPESCACGNKIIANLASRTTIDFTVIKFFSNTSANPTVYSNSISTLQANTNTISFHDIGPPGSFSPTIPLYLQLSVLRI